MTKTCTKCGVKKPLDQFYRHKECKDGRRSDCKACCKLARAEWGKANYEKDLKYRNDWYKRNKEVCSAYAKTTKAKTCNKRTQEKGRESLADWYVRKSLCQGTGIDVRDVPAELVNVAREHIRLKRRLKEIKNGTYSYPTETDHGPEVADRASATPFGNVCRRIK